MNRGHGITLEAFARVHKVPERWLELRRSCEEIVRHADFWYRPDLKQAASELAVEASNLLASAVAGEERKQPGRANALVAERGREPA